MDEPSDRRGRASDSSDDPGNRVHVEVQTPHGTLHLEVAADEQLQLVKDRFEAEGQHRVERRLFHVSRHGGRSCESCARTIERRLLRIDGITQVDLSFLSGLLRITYDPVRIDSAEIDAAVDAIDIDVHDPDRPNEESVVRFDQFRIEVAFVIITLVGMMGGLVAGYLGAATEVIWGLYGLAYVFGGYYGLLGAIESLEHYRVDIDVLMLTAAIGAALIGAPFEGAMLLFLFSLSNVLQRYAFGRSRAALRTLLELRPDTARLLVDGDERVVPIGEVDLGDIFRVRPGDRIPLDGTVLDGTSAVDEASLTGESVPISKEPTDEVFAGTIVEDGSLEVEVTRLAHESTIARLIHLVEEAQSEKAPTQRIIDRLEQPYVMGVFTMTLLAVAIPAMWGAPWFETIYRAMTLMVAASPCAVIISTPAVVLSAITSGARSGVLFKGGEYVESTANIEAVAFDKTGTLTMGETRLESANAREGAKLEDDSITNERVLELAAGVQSRSEHHLAEATVEAAAERNIRIPDVSEFHAVPGKGVTATVDGYTIHIGNRRYISDLGVDSKTPGYEIGSAAIEQLEKEGQTAVFVLSETDIGLELIGWLGYTDTIREGAREVIGELREQGIERILMLTGDNERVAKAVASEVGIEEVEAELLPEQKVDIIEQLLEEHGQVAMLGDGVNDAPALATATVGIGMGGAGTDVALETADVVLMADDISKLPYVFLLGNRARRTLWVNFAIAFGAMGLMIVAIFARGLPLPLAVVGHEGSTVLVSLNGLRLLGFRK